MESAECLGQHQKEIRKMSSETETKKETNNKELLYMGSTPIPGSTGFIHVVVSK